MHERIILAGSGGQGVMTIGKAIARAAMLSNLHCTYFPSYGTEVRGGTANCQVVVSDEEIHSPVVEEADTVFALNQPSLERFAPFLTPDGLLLLNTSMAVAPEANGRLLAVPATDMANDLGNVRVANVILLGAWNRRRRLLDDDLLFDQFIYCLEGVPEKVVALNRTAYHAGADRGA